MRSCLRSFTLLPVAVQALAVGKMLEPRASNSSLQNIFAFGSSWTETVFDVNGPQPRPEDPIGNPAIGSTNNNEHGENYIEYLVTSYNTTLAYAYDFAVGGTVVNNSVVPSPVNVNTDLNAQITQYFHSTNSSVDYADMQGTLWTSSNSIFIVWMGDNDVLEISENPDTYNTDDTFTDLMDSYTADLDILYGYGARKFMFVSVPAQDRSPLVLSGGGGDLSTYIEVKNKYNDVLYQTVTGWAQNNTGIQSFYYNSTLFLDTRLDNLSYYGYNTNATCQIDSGDADDSDCIWYNNFHTSSRFHDAMAKNMSGLMTEFLGW